MAQRLKRLPAIQETPVPSLVQEDPLEKEMATALISSSNFLVESLGFSM